MYFSLNYTMTVMIQQASRVNYCIIDIEYQKAHEHMKAFITLQHVLKHKADICWNSRLQTWKHLWRRLNQQVVDMCTIRMLPCKWGSRQLNVTRCVFPFTQSIHTIGLKKLMPTIWKIQHNRPYNISLQAADRLL